MPLYITRKRLWYAYITQQPEAFVAFFMVAQQGRTKLKHAMFAAIDAEAVV